MCTHRCCTCIHLNMNTQCTTYDAADIAAAARTTSKHPQYGVQSQCCWLLDTPSRTFKLAMRHPGLLYNYNENTMMMQQGQRMEQQRGKMPSRHHPPPLAHVRGGRSAPSIHAPFLLIPLPVHDGACTVCTAAKTASGNTPSTLAQVSRLCRGTLGSLKKGLLRV